REARRRRLRGAALLRLHLREPGRRRSRVRVAGAGLRRRRAAVLLPLAGHRIAARRPASPRPRGAHGGRRRRRQRCWRSAVPPLIPEDAMAERLLAWVVPVTDARLEAVEALLTTIEADPSGNAALPFGTLPMVHFASLTLFDRDDSARRTLVFESNIDGRVARYVQQLVSEGGAAIDILFADAPGYRADAAVDHLMSTVRRPQLYHVGHPARSV